MGKILACSLIRKTTTYDDPRKWGRPAAEEVPEPREVALDRHPQMGFGFVAGSEKPVIVRWLGKLWRKDKNKEEAVCTWITK